jgi:heme-degrading monooxygenase HmoA
MAKEQLPGARDQHGYHGLYVLADRTSGKVMTISLWKSREDLKAVEAPRSYVKGRRIHRRSVAARGHLPGRDRRPGQ